MDNKRIFSGFLKQDTEDERQQAIDFLMEVYYETGFTDGVNFMKADMVRACRELGMKEDDIQKLVELDMNTLKEIV